MNTPLFHDQRLMVQLALAGFEDARQRFLAASVPGTTPQSVFVPLAEALWWTISADDGFGELADSGMIGTWASSTDYQDARNNDRSGRALAGLRYARDRCGHQLALIALEDGLRLPFRLPNATGSVFRWRPSAEIPQPREPSRQRQAGKWLPFYDDLLAGRPASMTLESAAQWFAHASGLAGI